jgi:hypothetical protein
MPTAKVCFWAGLVLFVAISLKEHFAHTMQVLRAVLIFELVMIPFMIFLLLAVTFFHRLTVFTDGISSFSPFARGCKPDFMLWRSMKAIRRRTVLGYKYYYIESDDNREGLWIPYSIKLKNEFTTLLREQAGSDNILCAELERQT